jgi:hypothetical protein
VRAPDERIPGRGLARAREERIAEETVSAIDRFSRMLGAIETGNWRSASDEASQLMRVLGRLADQLDLSVPGSGYDVAAYVAEHSQAYRVGHVPARPTPRRRARRP